jgi:predicted DNA-binding protein
MAKKSKKKAKKMVVPVYLEPEARDALKRLSDNTRVPQAAYIREGVDLVLKKYRQHLRAK